MNNLLRSFALGVLAVACGFGSVFVAFTHLVDPVSDTDTQRAAGVANARNPGQPLHYVINLTSVTEPIEMVTTQHPDALAKYQVYSRQLTINDTVWHQLRLGFFPDTASAEKIAESLRGDFPLARAAQASPREWTDRANAALVALVAVESSRSKTSKAGTGRAAGEQAKQARARTPSTLRVALSASPSVSGLGSPALGGTPTKCDELTAHPWDPHKLTEGVYWNQVPAARAVLACRKAVRVEPSARNMFQYARALAKSKEYVEAAEWYRESASQGYIQAQYALGDVYEFGEGVTVNYVLAQSWYKKAADQGYTHALAKLSRLESAALMNTRQQMATADPLSTSIQ